MILVGLADPGCGDKAVARNRAHCGQSARLADVASRDLAGDPLRGRELTGFEIFPLSLRDLSGLRFAREPVAGPAFHRGAFDLSTVGDTFLDLRGWGKGVAWVNGRNLGRFWRLGPQRSLYCPAPFLRQGRNEFVVLETDDRGHRTVQGLVTPVYTAAGIG